MHRVVAAVFGIVSTALAISLTVTIPDSMPTWFGCVLVWSMWTTCMVLVVGLWRCD